MKHFTVMFCCKILCNVVERSLTLKNLTPVFTRPKSFCRQDFQVKLYSTDMETGLLDPPVTVRGMKVFDETAFRKTITVPTVTVEVKYFAPVQSLLKKYYLKMPKLDVVRVNIKDDSKKIILLNPCLVKSWNDFSEFIHRELEKNKVTKESFSNIVVELGFDNWSATALIRTVLSGNEISPSSYSLIGHIVHLNLLDEMSEYKYVIAEILLRKVIPARTVVNKKNIIDNVYRNFEMEVLCGEPDFIVCVREHDTRFEFDFSKVYWNPRLSTEHKRIVDLITYKDVLFDVFAGVGPFAIPAAKKKCKVFANDLNPESYKWLNHSIRLNKKCENYLKTFNVDGGDFILNDAKSILIGFWQDNNFIGRIHFVMNLPALAPTFIRCFKGLLVKLDLSNLNAEKIKNCLPIIHCYFFTRELGAEKKTFELSSGLMLDNIEHSFFNVRTVATAKWMIRVTFQLPYNYLLAEDCSDLDEPSVKKFCGDKT